MCVSSSGTSHELYRQRKSLARCVLSLHCQGNLREFFVCFQEAALASQLRLEENRKEHSDLLESIWQLRKALEELQDQKAELEAQVDLLQTRSQRLQKRIRCVCMCERFPLVLKIYLVTGAVWRCCTRSSVVFRSQWQQEIVLMVVVNLHCQCLMQPSPGSRSLYLQPAIQSLLFVFIPVCGKLYEAAAVSCCESLSSACFCVPACLSCLALSFLESGGCFGHLQIVYWARRTCSLMNCCHCCLFMWQ